MRRVVSLDLRLYPVQRSVILSKGTEILYGGQSETGKSHLIRALSIAFCLAAPGLQAVLIRKKYSDIIKNHVNGPTGYRKLLKELVDLKQVSIVTSGSSPGIYFKNGSIISFVHCQDERQFDSAQGIEKHLLIIDEATQIPERLIRFFRAWVRMTLEFKATLPAWLREKLPLILYTSNPVGASVGFFRRHFVLARPHRAVSEVEGFQRQFIPAKSTDIKLIDQKARKGRLAGIGDPAVARALDIGDWNAPVGDFFPEWDEERHVIEDAEVPPEWTRFRVYDWGTADPAYCAWMAISPGAMLGGRYLRRGCLVVYREWYIAMDDDETKGRRMRNKDVAIGIVERTEPEFRGQPTFADSPPFDDRGGVTIEQTFRENGVTLFKGDTSRPAGWSQFRSLLIGEPNGYGKDERDPMLVVMRRCRWARDHIPMLSRHPSENKREDAQDKGLPTHVCDPIRLGCMVQKVVTGSKSSKVKELIEQLTSFSSRPKTLGSLGIDPYSEVSDASDD